MATAGSPGRPGCYSLRLQLTNRCQLRCGYCRPSAAQEPARLEFTPALAARLVGLLARLGVNRVRLTGGEPLLRTDVTEVVAALAKVEGLGEIALTTNGERLGPLALPLRTAGLSRVNVHIDSLDPDRYRRITGGHLAAALAGLHAAIDAGLSPKLNVVVQRGWNEDELPRFCDLARELHVQVRFIELMDTGVAPEIARQRFVSGREISLALHSLGARRADRVGSAPAVDYHFADGSRVGVIASESEPFCETCNRLRLTADGVLITCLYAGGGLALGAMAREGATDGDLLAAAAHHIARKTSRHPATTQLGVRAPAFSMASLGG
jgi:cyclic pyranopterin phosphate synthase